MKKLLYLLLLTCSISFGQLNTFTYIVNPPLIRPTSINSARTMVVDTVNKKVYSYPAGSGTVVSKRQEWLNSGWFSTGGTNGKDATVTVGTTLTGAPNTPATVTNTGTPSNAVLNFVIPQGQKGDPGTSGGGSSSGFVKSYGTVRHVFNESDMIAALADAKLGKCTQIYLDTTIWITKTLDFDFKSNYFTLILDLQGNAIIDNSPSGLPYMIYAGATSTADANSKMDRQIIIENGEIRGKEMGGTGTLVYLAATQNSKISQMHFWKGKIQVQLDFCLKAIVENSMFWFQDSISLNINYGRKWGGTPSGDQSNNVRGTSLRFFAKDGAYTDILVDGVSGTDLQDITCEGGSPKYLIIYSNANSSVVWDFHLKQVHFETTPQIAGLWIITDKGYAVVEGLFTQYAMTLVKTTFPAFAELYLSNVPYLPTGTKFETNGGAWDISGFFPNTFNVSDKANWINGIVPDGWEQTGYDSNYNQNHSAKNYRINGKIPTTN